jgi:asparagine synthase (glutamine-hydrolysing)
MASTVELRSPFLDTKLVDYAMKIDGSLKVVNKNHKSTVKYILREVARDFLPEYISNRYKVPIAN